MSSRPMTMKYGPRLLAVLCGSAVALSAQNPPAVQPDGGAGDGGLAQIEARPAAAHARPHHDQARLGAADRVHGAAVLSFP